MNNTDIFNNKVLQDRLFNLSMPEPNTGCWIWIGASVPDGYGMSRIGRRNCVAHRVSYQVFVGPIPDGLVLDHLCRNPPCINPQHLEPVTRKENTLRGKNNVAVINKVKTHCPHGHEYDQKNTIRLKGDRRECRICRRRRVRNNYHRRKNRIQ